MLYATLPVHSGECTLPPQFGNFWGKFGMKNRILRKNLFKKKILVPLRHAA